MTNPRVILENMQAADEAAQKSQLAFLNGPEVYLEYLKEQFKETQDRLEKEYATYLDTGTKTG